MSFNPCIKTGANVWIDSHGGALHGDLYHAAGVYILRYMTKIDYAKFARNCDAIFMIVKAEDNVGRDSPPHFVDLNPFRSDCGTLIIQQDFVILQVQKR